MLLDVQVKNALIWLARRVDGRGEGNRIWRVEGSRICPIVVNRIGRVEGSRICWIVVNRIWQVEGIRIFWIVVNRIWRRVEGSRQLGGRRERASKIKRN